MPYSNRSFPAFQALQDAFDGWKEALRVPRLESKPREAERGLHGPAPGGRDVLFEAFRRRFSPIFTDFHRFFNDFAWFLLGFVDVSSVFARAPPWPWPTPWPCLRPSRSWTCETTAWGFKMRSAWPCTRPWALKWL